MKSICAYCHEAPCTAACPRGNDPGRALFSLRMENPVVIEDYINGSCLGCSVPCETACPIKFPILRTILTESVSEEKVDVDYGTIKTDFFGFPLDNPFLLSSSVVSSTYDMCLRALDMGWAGVAYKTVCLMDIHESSPRFSAIRSQDGSFAGFTNIEQLSDHSLMDNLKVFRELKKARPQKLILASIMGRNEKEWAFLAKACEEAGADGLELNFSCPNMTLEGVGSDVGQDNELIERYARAVKQATKLPVLAKLTPNVAEMGSAARAALRGGADGIAAINTIKSLIPYRKQGGYVAVGGYSGPAVRPIALRFAAEICQLEEMQGRHFSGMGGIYTWKDALDMITLGANTLQITTAVMELGYRIIDDLKYGLARHFSKHHTTLKFSVGAKLKEVSPVSSLTRDKIVLPRFSKEKCIGCLRCHLSCQDGGHQAIKIGANRRPELDFRKCVGCHLCILVCPQGAIDASQVTLNAAKSKSAFDLEFERAVEEAYSRKEIYPAERERWLKIINERLETPLKED